MFKSSRTILIVALIARLFVFFVVLLSGLGLSHPLDSRAVKGGDSGQYLLLAENMVEHGAFSLREEPPYLPDTNRTPGYPLLLAGLYLIAGREHSPILIVAVQVVLSVLNVWLLIQIGKKLFTPTIANVAGLLYALAPATLIFTGLVMTETLFATLLLVSFYLLIQILNASGRRLWGLAVAFSVCFAVGVYVRPIGLYALPIPLLATAVRLGWNRRTFVLLLTMVLVYVISMSPWYLRNYGHYQTVVLSSLASHNLFIYNVGSIEAHRQGISWREAKDQLWAELEQRLAELNITNPNEVQTSQVMDRLAIEHILADPLSAAFYQVTDMINSLRPGYSMAAILTRDDPNDLGGEVQSGNLEAIVDSAPLELVIFGLMTIYYGVLYIATAIGGLLLVYRRQWYILILCGLTPLWFMFQAGIAGNARFRAPVEGLLSLIAAAGLVWVAQFVMQRTSPVLRSKPHST